MTLGSHQITEDYAEKYTHQTLIISVHDIYVSVMLFVFVFFCFFCRNFVYSLYTPGEVTVALIDTICMCECQEVLVYSYV